VSASGTRILIVYHSNKGHTRRMADVVADGVRSVGGALAIIKTVDEVQRSDLKDCNALIIGSPVQQRSMSWEVKRFMDLVCEPSWFYDDMVGRVGGVFTTGGGHGECGAGCELAQISMLGNLASLGMIIVTLPKTTPGFDVAGLHWGPHIRTNDRTWRPVSPDEMDLNGLEAAFHHGANIARVATALRGSSHIAQGNISPPAAVREARARMEGTVAQLTSND
jgi:NAD(P)H dehydrogenase (quinone)